MRRTPSPEQLRTTEASLMKYDSDEDCLVPAEGTMTTPVTDGLVDSPGGLASPGTAEKERKAAEKIARQMVALHSKQLRTTEASLAG